jgi:hypothetical protein
MKKSYKPKDIKVVVDGVECIPYEYMQDKAKEMQLHFDTLADEAIRNAIKYDKRYIALYKSERQTGVTRSGSMEMQMRVYYDLHDEIDGIEDAYAIIDVKEMLAREAEQERD